MLGRFYDNFYPLRHLSHFRKCRELIDFWRKSSRSSCLVSNLSRTGKRAVVHDRIISDMLRSMELERPRATLVLPECDLGVVLRPCEMLLANLYVRPL